METKNYHRFYLRNRLIFGGLMIVVGIVLLGLNFGFIPQTLKPIFFSWKMLIILLGIFWLFYANYLKGIALILAGAFFLIPDFHKAFPDTFWWVSEDFVQIYWPVLLVLGGILFVIYWLSPEKYRRKHYRHDWHHSRHGKPHFLFHSYHNAGCKCEGEDNGENKKFDFDAQKFKKQNKRGGMLNINVIFAGSNDIFLDEVFNGGTLDAICGGINLDLRRTKLPEGETYLHVDVILGGIEIYVPNTWFVEIRTDAIMGGFTDSRLADRENMDRSRKLIITGSFILGGGDIR